MEMKIKLLSIDFDGTLVSHVSEPVLDEPCLQLIRDLQSNGVLFSINTGRSVDLLESGLTDFEFPMRPDFILTTERSEEHTSELQSLTNLVCRLLLEKKKNKNIA